MTTKQHVFLIGPPAVGKLTVGHLLSQGTGFPLYDNAKSIDTATLLFKYGTEDFRKFRDELRFSFYSKATTSCVTGLISSCCLARSSWPYIRRVEALLSANSWRTSYFLLTADDTTIQSRAEFPDRQQKVALTAPTSIKDWLAKNWPPTFPKGIDIQQIDTSNVTASDTATRIKTLLDMNHEPTRTA